MSSTLLIVLGLVLMFITIMIAIFFMIAGGFRRSLADIRVLAASGIVGLLMIALGVLPWGIAVIGMIVLAVGGLAFFFFIWSPSHGKEKLKGDVLKMREYISRKHVRPVLHRLIRVWIVIGAIVLSDVVGLCIFLFSKGQWSFSSFVELMAILLLLEGSLIGAFGGFTFFGYSEYRIAGQAAINPAIALDQVQRWAKRRSSQKKWGLDMLIVGGLLIFLGLLVSFLTSV